MIKSIIARPPPKALQFYLKSNFSIPISQSIVQNEK